MPISAYPKQHRVQIGVAPGQRLVFVFDYPSEEQYKRFASGRFRMDFDAKTMKVNAQDVSSEALSDLADELLVDFWGEQQDDQGEWFQDEATDMDDQPIDTSKPGWKEKILPVYKMKATGWIQSLADMEAAALKNSGPSCTKKSRSSRKRTKTR